MKWLLYIVIVLLGLFVIGILSQDKTTSAYDKPLLTQGKHMAAYTEADFDKACEHAAQKDYQALGRLVQAGRVFSLKANTEVYLIDQRIFENKVKLRQKGSTADFWTFREVIGK